MTSEIVMKKGFLFFLSIFSLVFSAVRSKKEDEAQSYQFIVEMNMVQSTGINLTLLKGDEIVDRFKIASRLSKNSCDSSQNNWYLLFINEFSEDLAFYTELNCEKTFFTMNLPTKHVISKISGFVSFSQKNQNINLVSNETEGKFQSFAREQAEIKEDLMLVAKRFSNFDKLVREQANIIIVLLLTEYRFQNQGTGDNLVNEEIIDFGDEDDDDNDKYR